MFPLSKGAPGSNLCIGEFQQSGVSNSRCIFSITLDESLDHTYNFASRVSKLLQLPEYVYTFSSRVQMSGEPLACSVPGLRDARSMVIYDDYGMQDYYDDNEYTLKGSPSSVASCISRNLSYKH